MTLPLITFYTECNLHFNHSQISALRMDLNLYPKSWRRDVQDGIARHLRIVGQPPGLNALFLLTIGSISPIAWVIKPLLCSRLITSTGSELDNVMRPYK